MRRQTRQTQRKKANLHWPKLHWPVLNRNAWILLLLTVLLLIFNIFIIPELKKPKTKVNRSRAVEINLAVNDVLTQFDIGDEQIAVLDSAVSVKIPQKFQFFGFYSILRSKLAEIDAAILDCRKTDDDAILMIVGEKDVPVESYLFVKSKKLLQRSGRAAIIIDDFGYSYSSIARTILTMDVPLTISIIPGLKASKKIADIAQVHKKEILVHMPMEPLYEKFDDNGFTLVVGQDPGITSLRIRQAFSQLPLAVGMNNHQGSRATADPQLMQIVMRTLYNMNKFFIDSRTNSKSIAWRVARNMHLKTNYSNFFLDAKDDEKFILAQFEQLAQRAKSDGSVIAIGHPRRRTLKALQAMIPKLEAMGVTFVYVSELVK